MKLKSYGKRLYSVEMLVVLLIISVLTLLFVPNLTTKGCSEDKGKVAVKVVESQAELYSLDKMKMPVYKMLSKGLLKNTMQNRTQVKQLWIKAFTMLLESLLVLGIVSLLALGLSSSVQSTFWWL